MKAAAGPVYAESLCRLLLHAHTVQGGSKAVLWALFSKNTKSIHESKAYLLAHHMPLR